MSDKIYVGTGKAREFPDGGQILKMAFSANDVDALRHNLRDGWVRINISKRREPSQSGQTHYGTIDTWQPTGNRPAAQAPEAASTRQDDDTGGKLPF